MWENDVSQVPIMLFVKHRLQVIELSFQKKPRLNHWLPLSNDKYI